jgi:hypothetical protein
LGSPSGSGARDIGNAVQQYIGVNSNNQAPVWGPVTTRQSASGEIGGAPAITRTSTRPVATNPLTLSSGTNGNAPALNVASRTLNRGTGKALEAWGRPI